MAVLARAVRAGGVAARVLDLEDVGAVVAEQHGADGGGVDGPQVEDADAGERAVSELMLLWLCLGVCGGGHRRGDRMA